MKLMEILSRFGWQELEPCYLRLYPKEKRHKKTARDAFAYIKSLQPVSTGMRIEIDYRDDAEGGYHEVLGQDGTLRADGLEESFCLALVDWEEWLGMEINPTSQQRYADLDIVCHCLWEMTWFGYSMEQIVQAREDLDRQAEEFSVNDEDWRKVLENP